MDEELQRGYMLGYHAFLRCVLYELDAQTKASQFAELAGFIKREGVVFQQRLPAFKDTPFGSGDEICVYPRIYNAILTLGESHDPHGYTTHYCYDNPVQARNAAIAWMLTGSAEPEGWFRHATSGRRRPNGDLEQEYIAL